MLPSSVYGIFRRISLKRPTTFTQFIESQQFYQLHIDEIQDENNDDGDAIASQI